MRPLSAWGQIMSTNTAHPPYSLARDEGSVIETQEKMLDAALAYAESGLAILPVAPLGKTALIKEWPEKATSDTRIVRQWWERWPDANIGIHVGKSSIVVLDIDPRNGGDASLEGLKKKHGSKWISQLTVKTGGGGQHFIYAQSGCKNLPSQLAPGIDLKHGSGYVVAPPSVHPSGGIYQFEKCGLTGGEVDFLPSVPDWFTTGKAPLLVDDVFSTIRIEDPETPENIERVKSALDAISADCGRDDWRNVLFAITSTGWECAPAIAREWSLTAPHIFEERAFLNVIGSAKADRPNAITLGTLFSKAIANGWKDPLKKIVDDGHSLEDRTDAGNVNLLFRLTGGDLRYIGNRETWIQWDGKQWREDEHSALAQSAALRIGDYYLKQADSHFKKASDPAMPTDEQKRARKNAEGLKKYGHGCRNKASIDAALALSKRDARFLISDDELNKDPELLGVKNGVVDLRTGELKPDARDDLVTRRCPVNYTPGTPSQRFEEFIYEITGTGKRVWSKRPELARYVQKMLGYCLTGHTREHKMFIWIGPGANGKSVLLDTIQAIMGPHCVTISPELLMTAKNPDPEKATPMLMRLINVRLAVAAESKRIAEKMDASLIKRHTGGGFLSGRANYSSGQQWEMSHKLTLMTNHLPDLDSLDEATRGRIHAVPFERQWNRPGAASYDPELPDADPTLYDRLKAEREGILAYLVDGAVAYFAEGLQPPEEVRVHTRQYFTTQDPISRFLTNFERCDPKDGTHASRLFSAYGKWCYAENEVLSFSNTAFGREVKESRHKIDSKKINGYMCYGLRATVDFFEEGL